MSSRVSQWWGWTTYNEAGGLSETLMAYDVLDAWLVVKGDGGWVEVALGTKTGALTA